MAVRKSRHFNNAMELYILENYKEIYPELKNRSLTDKLIEDCLIEYRVKDFKLSRTAKGKPYIELCKKSETLEEGCKVHLSVSHSEGIFVCIIGDKPLGIDVQHRRKVSSAKIADKYFTETEREYIKKYGEDGFFKVWTRKEAYSKLTGKGLEVIMSGASVLDRDDVEFTDIQLEDGILCSYCVAK